MPLPHFDRFVYQPAEWIGNLDGFITDVFTGEMIGHPRATSDPTCRRVFVGSISPPKYIGTVPWTEIGHSHHSNVQGTDQLHPRLSTVIKSRLERYFAATSG